MSGQLHESSKRIQIIRLVEVVFTARKSLLVIIASFTALGILLAFIVTREYKAVVRVLPPKEQSILAGLGGLSSLVRGLPPGLTKLGAVEDTYDYMAILRSRTILEQLVREFDLLAVYDISDGSMERAVKALKNNTEIDWTEEGTLELRVWDVDAQRAADIANAYIAHLNKRSIELQTQEARNTRSFIEQRLQQTRRELFAAEEALQEYQKQQGMIIPIDPSSTAVAPLAELYVLKVQKEIELSILQQTVGETNPLYVQALLEVEAMSSRISRFPELGIQSLRLAREVVIQQKILEVIIPLYEQAKVNANKDVPVAYILDPAIPGERPDRPKRIAVIAISIFIGCVIALVVIGYRESVAGMKNSHPDEWERWRSVIRSALHRKSS
jgi:tyrosine-protein kinase Etk/Wzc